MSSPGESLNCAVSPALPLTCIRVMPLRVSEKPAVELLSCPLPSALNVALLVPEAAAGQVGRIAAAAALEHIIAVLSGGVGVDLAVEGHLDRSAAGIENELVVARRAGDGERRNGKHVGRPL